METVPVARMRVTIIADPAINALQLMAHVVQETTLVINVILQQGLLQCPDPKLRAAIIAVARPAVNVMVPALVSEKKHIR